MPIQENWPIRDREGFADLRIGDLREDVLRRFGGQPDADGVRVHFDREDRVRLIELTAPTDPTVRGVHLMGQPLQVVLRRLLMRGLDYVPGTSGGTIAGWDVGLRVPHQIVVGVSIGKVTRVPG